MKYASAFLLVATLVAATPGYSQTFVYFDPVVDSSWSTAGNWFLDDQSAFGAVPGTTERASVDASVAITDDDNVQLEFLLVGRENISGVVLDIDSTHTVTADRLNIDFGGGGADGSVTINVASDITIADEMLMGVKNGSATSGGTAILNITGGTFMTDHLYTGQSATSVDGYYEINISGGTLASDGAITFSNVVQVDTHLNVSGDASIYANRIDTGRPGTTRSGSMSVSGSEATILLDSAFLLQGDSDFILDFDSGGISTVDAGNAFYFNNLADITINGNGFNTPGVYDLVVSSLGGSYTNSFDEISISGFGPNIGAANLIYDGADDGDGFGLRLELVEGTSPDLDSDGDVDIADLMMWQRNDGSADGLAVWQTHFTGGAAAVSMIPEPSSLGLLACMALALAGTRDGLRRSRS